MNPDVELDFIISEIKHRKDTIAKLQSEIDDIRLEASDRILQHGNYASPVGSIELVRASQRVTYDNKVIQRVSDELLEVRPDLTAQLEGAKKITFIAESWRIK